MLSLLFVAPALTRRELSGYSCNMRASGFLAVARQLNYPPRVSQWARMSNAQPSARRFSFEFFPPRSPEAAERLAHTADALAGLRPDYFSVTFGAGGSTRERTFETVQDVRQRTAVRTAPHISCIGASLVLIRETLRRYQDAGIDHLVALRGDMPSGTVGYGDLRYASELVNFIRDETGKHFHIEVACYPEVHPQAEGAASDLSNLKRKVDAGANGAITQYFFNADAYVSFRNECNAAGISVPITAGVMPITNATQLLRFSETCGAEVPRWIRQRLRDFGDDRIAIREFGIEVLTRLCQRLLEAGAPGLHFYTLNQADAAVAVCKNLDLEQWR